MRGDVRRVRFLAFFLGSLDFAPPSPIEAVGEGVLVPGRAIAVQEYVSLARAVVDELAQGWRYQVLPFLAPFRPDGNVGIAHVFVLEFAEGGEPCAGECANVPERTGVFRQVFHGGLELLDGRRWTFGALPFRVVRLEKLERVQAPVSLAHPPGHAETGDPRFLYLTCRGVTFDGV